MPGHHVSNCSHSYNRSRLFTACVCPLSVLAHMQEDMAAAAAGGAGGGGGKKDRGGGGDAVATAAALAFRIEKKKVLTAVLSNMGAA